jgi:two-component system, NarL family, response regulator DevR
MPLNVAYMQASPRAKLPSAPRVVIVDADRRVLQSLSDLLGVSGEVEVVGRAGDVRSALEEVERVNPDVVLVDPRLPDVDAGMALIGGMTRAWPSIRVVITGWGDNEARPALNGHSRYVSKGSSPEEFVDAIVAGCRD